MENPEEVGTSKEKPIEIDDEESSDENSVIILDSDTEKEDNGEEEGEEEEDNDEDSVDDDEEDSDEEETEDDDSETSSDSDSGDSVWSDAGEEIGDEITTEAAEAKIIKKFEKAIISIADQDVEKGQKILEQILEDPIISCFHIDDPDYETIEEPPRLAKMLQIYIATHKNLAKLCEKSNLESDSDLQNEEIQHLRQVLAYDPNNSEIWLDMALKCVEFGDLNFGEYAFKRSESLKESLESQATLLYLKCNYTQCLEILKQIQEGNDGLNDKMKYLKMKIRSTNHYYQQLCDKIFDEDEVYVDIDIAKLNNTKIVDFDERIDELRKKVQEKVGIREEEFEEEKRVLETVPIQIYAEQDLKSICTVFCDLFDRIHSYSHCRYQLLKITEWESRSDYLQVQEIVEKLVDIVECVEELTEKVEESEVLAKKKKGKRQKMQEKKEYLANWRKRLFVEKSNDDVITLDSEANSTADEGDDDVVILDDEETKKKNGEMPENELAQEFHLVYTDVESIMCGERKREKTPPPSQPSEFIDCDAILHLLQLQFSHGSHTILDFLEHTLHIISEHSPNLGAIPDSMKEVIREMYYRIALFSEIKLRKYYRLNMILMELDARKALEVMVSRHVSYFFKEPEVEDSDEKEDVKEVDSEEERLLELRFMWKYTQTGLSDEIRLDYLQSLRDRLQPEESIATSCGSFTTCDVDIAIDSLEKKKRIDSIKTLWKSGNYQNLVEILTKDIDFTTVGIDEAIELIEYWIQSQEKLKSSGDLMEIIARAMHFYLFIVENASKNTIKAEKIEKNLQILLHKMQGLTSKESLKVSKKRLPTLSTIGYFICVMFKKYKKFEKDWKNWKILYEIVKIQRGDAKEYIERLDKNEEPTVMPLLELDLLVKAHEVLGEYHCCAQKNYEFLFFIVDRLQEVIDNIPILEICYQKDNGYLWNNLNLEISQVLFCLFGKYARKMRLQENHENGGKCATTPEIAKKIMALILVQPLPLYDEKEKLMHDVVELLNTKFPFLLEVSREKKEKIKEFKALLQKADTLKDVESSLSKCQDDVHDYIQTLVWYAMALNAFKGNVFKEAAKYSELYLLTEESMTDDRLRSSVWGMMAHASVHDLFQLELEEIDEQWKWRIMPSRMAIDAQQKEPLPHFDLAARLYQLASSLTRFHRTLPRGDPRRHNTSEITKLRIESREQFDKALELTKLGEDGSQPEHQWLCYYFIGKLEAKRAQWDILKVVESFYEAACGCELAGFYYPQKVQTKKQTNFEPLEVHYQAYSAVYKYLINNDIPDLETLRKLKIWLKLMNDGHKVVKSNSSLFKVNLDVYTIVDELVMDTVFEEKGEITPKFTSDLRHELASELKEMCIRAFTLITDRFPHTKSHYRLAQLYMEKGEIDQASNQIFKNAFKKRKRDDGLFDNLVEISCSDINRNGSHSFHIDRCLKLGAQIAPKTCDLHHVVAVLLTMIGVIVKDDEEHVDKIQWKSIVTLYLGTMELIISSRDNSSCRSTPSPGPQAEPIKKTKPHHLQMKTLRTELWRLWIALSKCSKPSEELIKTIKAKTQDLINRVFKSVDELRARMHPNGSSNDPQKKQKTLMMKRKIDGGSAASGIAQQALKNLNLAANSTIGTQKTINDFALKLAQNQLGNTPNALNDYAVQILALAQSSAGGNAANNKALSELALKLAQAAQQQQQQQQKAKATAPSTSTQPKPTSSASTSSTAPSAPKPSAAPPTSSSSSTSTAQQRPPHYSPISDDDDVQCLDPPPAKKPAPAPVAPAPVAAPPRMVPSVFGGVKAANPAQKVTSSGVAMSSQKPSTSSGASTSSQKSSSIQKASTSSQKPQNPPTSSTQKPSTSTNITGAATAQFANILAQFTPEQIMQQVTQFMNSGDPQKKLMAGNLFNYMIQQQQKQQATPTKQTPPTSQNTTPVKMNPNAMLAQAAKEAAEKAEKAKKAQEQAKQIQLALQQQQAKASQDAMIKMVQEQQAKQFQAALQQKQKEEAKKRAEAQKKAEAQRKAAAEVKRQADIQAKKQAEAKAAQEQRAKQMAFLKQQQQMNQQLAATWKMLNQQQQQSQQQPSTSASAPNLLLAQQQQLQKQQQQQRIHAPKTVKQTAPGNRMNAPSSTSSRPTGVPSSSPQIVRPQAQRPPFIPTSLPSRPSQTTRPQFPPPPPTSSSSSSAQIRQSTSSSSLLNAAARPTASSIQAAAVRQQQINAQQQMTQENVMRVLNSIQDPAQREAIMRQLYNQPPQ